MASGAFLSECAVSRFFPEPSRHRLKKIADWVGARSSDKIIPLSVAYETEVRGVASVLLEGILPRPMH